MYPDYKEMATNSLMGEFIRLVNHQMDRVFFDDAGMVALDAGGASPVYFSTRDIINIARLLKDIRVPKGWRDMDAQKVYELAAAAEQHEHDDPDHLLHTMMRLQHECETYGSGQLLICTEEEAGAFSVLLVEDLTGLPLVDWLSKVPVTENGKTTYYTLQVVTLRYIEAEKDWVLTFKAMRNDDREEVKLSGEAIYTGLKKDIADLLIDWARKGSECDTPLEKLGRDYWVAPRQGVVEVDDILIPTAITSITECNILEVEAGTTGPQGGDSGHGCRTYLRITNDASTDLRCVTACGTHDADCVYHLHKKDHGHVDQVEILLGGDSELSTLSMALRFAADVLEKQQDGTLHIGIPKKFDAKNSNNNG